MTRRSVDPDNALIYEPVDIRWYAYHRVWQYQMKIFAQYADEIAEPDGMPLPFEVVEALAVSTNDPLDSRAIQHIVEWRDRKRIRRQVAALW